MNFFWHDSKNLSSFFFENNSKNWLLSKIWFKELNFFLSMTQRIELTFFWIRLNESIPFFWMWLNWNLGWKKKSKNWTFLTQNWTFLHMTRRIELLFVFEFGLKELNLLLFDSKNWAFFLLDAMHWTFSCFPQRIHWVTLENKKGSILWVISEKKSWIRVVLENFNSSSRIQKKNSILKKSHIQKKKINSVIRIEKKKFCDSYSYFKKKFHFESHSEKRINSSSHFWKIFWKESSSLWAIKSQILWVFFFCEKNQVFESCYTEGLNSSSHIGKNLWVILKKSSVLCIVFLVKAQFFESFFFFFDKNSKIQFFDSCSRNFNSLSHFFEKILRVMLKKVQFFESHKKKSSILWVYFFFFEKSFIFLEKNVKTSQKKWVRFFESYSKKRKVLFFCHAQKKKHFFELHSKKVQFFESVFFF